MSSGHKLNPAIAKETSNGQILCIICSMQVKPKVWTAHINGRKHKDNASRLKQQLSSSSKRVQDVHEEAPASKKAKEEEPETTPSGGGLPSDFFDNQNASQPSTQTPWQKGRQQEKETLKHRDDVIEGVPQGFFDDKKRDEKVRETVEKNEQMELELARFDREMNAQNMEEMKQIELEDERDARERDIQNCDDQIHEWKRALALEERAEQVIQKVKQRGPIKKVEESSDDEEIDMDFGWRAKGIV